ncbi:MAG: STAS domain-containing protein [Alphaproteobacteria bacterium]|nr:STAS domain-containing protein [Alphaproteobacteria bacterium]
MDIRQELTHGTLDVHMSGKFTFPDHLGFRDVIDKMNAGDIQQVVLNVEKMDFIDSAGLGMLLLALDAAEKNHKKLVIGGATGQVKKMFDLARFENMFTLN